MNRQRPHTANSFANGLLLLGVTFIGLFFVRQWRENGHPYYEFLVGGAVLALLGVALLIRNNRCWSVDYRLPVHWIAAMPDTTEFKMSYPAYVPKTPEGAPELVEIDGNVCVCLYTNRKALERFYIDKYSPTAAFLSVPAWSFISAAELVAFLTKSKRQFVQQECRFVAVNVQPGLPPTYVTIAAFVEDLERTA